MKIQNLSSASQPRNRGENIWRRRRGGSIKRWAVIGPLVGGPRGEFWATVFDFFGHMLWWWSSSKVVTRDPLEYLYILNKRGFFVFCYLLLCLDIFVEWCHVCVIHPEWYFMVGSITRGVFFLFLSFLPSFIFFFYFFFSLFSGQAFLVFRYRENKLLI